MIAYYLLILVIFLRKLLVLNISSVIYPCSLIINRSKSNFLKNSPLVKNKRRLKMRCEQKASSFNLQSLHSSIKYHSCQECSNFVLPCSVFQLYYSLSIADIHPEYLKNTSNILRVFHRAHMILIRNESLGNRSINPMKKFFSLLFFRCAT